MPTCKLCYNLEKKDEADPRLGFDFSPEQLIQSVNERGCLSCTVILEGLRSSEQSNWKFQRDVRRVLATCRGWKVKHIATLSLEIYFVDDRSRVVVEFVSLDGQPWKAAMPRSWTNGHPRSADALTWVKSLIRKCEKEHTLCRTLGIRRLPKRVLFISLSQGSIPTVKLVENSKESAHYAALSHCWGTHQSLVTTKRTLDAHKCGVEWSLLPKTFQEAILFSLDLNINYLWVDSLCIIQDDVSDWEVESSKMAKIYEYAHITLAATASSSDSQGCYAPYSDRGSTHKLLIPSVYTDSRPVAIRASLEHWDSLTGTSQGKLYPLLSRAWVFQERLLSRRMLHFCASELVWECRETSICECGSLHDERSPGGHFHLALKRSEDEGAKSRPSAFPPPILQQLPSYAEAQTSFHGDTSAASPEVWARFGEYQDLIRQEIELDRLREPTEASQQWRQLVEQYSALQITRPSDRLPALSGICEKVKHIRGEYLAGLWSDSILLDLLWRVDRLTGTRDTSQHSVRRRPSWSWISVDSPVRYWTDVKSVTLEFPPDVGSLRVRKLMTLARMRRAGYPTYLYKTIGENPYGEVASAILSITAYHCDASLHIYQSDTSAPGVTASGHVTNYQIRCNGHDFHMFADYPLNCITCDTVLVGKPVQLLVIHPLIALVLIMSEPGQASSQESPYEGNSADKIIQGFWERIGIVRIPKTFLDQYNLDWMPPSPRLANFKII